MRPSLIAGLVVCALAGAQDEGALKSGQDATVLLKWDFQSEPLWASGVVYKRDGDSAYVVTTALLVCLNGYRTNEGQVTLRSGSSKAANLKGTVVGIDLDRGLAVIKVTGKDLPDALAPADISALKETDNVRILGHTAGQDFGVGAGSISSFRKNDDGKLAFIQIDAALEGAYAGGAVVDGKGKLIGIALARVRGTKIGFVLPCSELDEMFAGYALDFRRDVIENKDGVMRMKAILRTVDPLHKLKNVSLLIANRDKLAEFPERVPKGGWKPVVAEMEEHVLTIGDEEAAAEIALKAPSRQDATYVLQPKWTRADGSVGIGAPSLLGVDFTKGMASTLKKPAKDDWIGIEAGTRRVSSDTGTVGAGGADLTVAVEDKSGVTTTILKLDSPEGAQICWTSDGASLLVLTAAGVLRKVSPATLREEKVLTIGRRCSAIAANGTAMFVIVSELQELWILDEGTFTVRRKVPVGAANQIATSSKSALVYVTTWPTRDPEPLLIVDTASGRVLRAIHARRTENATAIKRPKSLSVGFREWCVPALTPDGSALFTVSIEAIRRLRVDGDDVVYEEAGDRLAMDGKRVHFSVDGSRLAVTAYRIPGADSKEKELPGVLFFKPGSLGDAVGTFRSNRGLPEAVAVDAACGRGFLVTDRGVLLGFNANGEQEFESELGGGDRGRPRAALLHPRDRRGFVVFERGIVRVDLPK